MFHYWGGGGGGGGDDHDQHSCGKTKTMKNKCIIRRVTK